MHSFLLFVLLVALQTATGYMVSDQVLRSSSLALDRTKLRRKEKRKSEIFAIFCYLPFSLAALYYFNLKIYDYFLIICFYWLLLKNHLVPSACVFGVLVYHNILYLDLILVPFFVMMSEPLRSRAKYVLCSGAIFLGLHLFDNYLLELYVSFALLLGSLSLQKPRPVCAERPHSPTLNTLVLES